MSDTPETDTDPTAYGAPPADPGAPDPLATLPPDLRRVVEDRIAHERNAAYASARRTFTGAKGKATPPATRSNAPAADGSVVATRAAAFAAAGYGPDEIARYAGDLSISAPPPPPASRPQLGAPVTSGGPPPPASAYRDDMRIIDMSIADRNALLAKLGPIEFSSRLKRELSSVRVGPHSGRR
ncbi:MAG: hypothetical protein JNK64_20915 [Myxococcales bacterium]|nr:hypothetical protein [Myxococcales bacterium]